MLITRFSAIAAVLFQVVSVDSSWLPKRKFSERRKEMKMHAVVAAVASEDLGGFPKRSWRNRVKEAHEEVAMIAKAESVPSAGSESGQQTITDHGDTFVTISLEIGSQQIKAIPDSGSFELYIVDGQDCKLDMCKPAYNPEKSQRHFEPSQSLKKDIYFGSGTCGVELSFDSVKIHNEAPDGSGISPALVPLWRIVEMDDNLAGVWGDGEGFQGIVGLGFKGNVHKEPSELLLEEKVVLETKRKTGVDPAKPGLASKALFGDVFAICLPRGEDAKPVEVFLEQSRPSQQDGRLWWGTAVPALSFNSVPVVGTRHWTIKIDSAHFQFTTGGEKLHHICGGPSSSPCAALVDSGTSLIAMSPEKINELLSSTVIGDLDPSCSNVDQMPDLIFNLGHGETLTLTPDTYVMKISTTQTALHDAKGRVVLDKGKVLNIRPPPVHLMALKGSKPDSNTYCTHAFMETPMETATVGGTEHELIILGIPVFREYTVKFDRKKETLGFAAHPFGVTCHSGDLSRAPPASLAQTERRQPHIRTLGKLSELVFPDEFARI